MCKSSCHTTALCVSHNVTIVMYLVCIHLQLLIIVDRLHTEEISITVIIYYICSVWICFGKTMSLFCLTDTYLVCNHGVQKLSNIVIFYTLSLVTKAVKAVTYLARASAMSSNPWAVTPFLSQTTVWSLVLICRALLSIRAPKSPIPLPLVTHINNTRHFLLHCCRLHAT